MAVGADPCRDRNGPAWFWLDAPASVATGAPFDITLYALDDYGHLATGYTGTVTFFSTDADPAARLSADYTFTTAAHGAVGIAVVPGGAPGERGGRPRCALDWLFSTDLLGSEMGSGYRSANNLLSRPGR